MAAAVSAFAGCQDELDQNKVKEGDYIPFAISEEKTRTAYSDTDEFQINWVDGDNVRVFCYEAEDVNYAEYGVTKDATEENTGKLNPNLNGLKWGGYENEHKFYAVYPSDADKISVDQSGIATVKVNLNQTATVGDLNGTVYPTTPDMTNACMVAYATGKASTTSKDKPITLAFKPIMTTLQIEVKGKNPEEVSDNESDVVITGISLSMTVPTAVAKTETFQYDIVEGLNDSEKGLIATNNENNTTTENIYINLKTNDNTDAVSLSKGQSVIITAFLPPVPIKDDNQVKVRVHATGETETTVTLGKSNNVEINASDKAILHLPYFPTNETGNNWITPLDDNIYVQQLSIPGTHDAAAYSTSLFDVGQTQTKTIEKQLEMGIRAFDMRPAYRRLYTKMWLYHGFTATDISLNDALQTMSNYLTNNKGEFIILQFKHETDGGIGVGKNTSKWDTIYDELNTFSSQIISWRPNLTIGECRGKFIIITRTDFTNREKLGAALTSSFDDNTSFVTTLVNGSYSTSYHVQDYYMYTDDEGTEKLNKIKSLYAITKEFCKATNNFPWALNHTSGYCGSIGSTLQYQKNANYVNKPIYEVLQNETVLGPTGIVFMDFVGERDASIYTVYGDLLPQAIIDNNYKYRMLRKGE